MQNRSGPPSPPEKVTKERAGIWWDSVVENVWKDTGGSQEETLSIEKFGGYKTELKERVHIRERLRNKVKKEDLLDIYGGLR